MRVVCQQCGAEYDFEQTLVSPRGTSVQCTACDDIFVVFAEGRTTSDISWLVRTEVGEEIRFESLRPLQSKLQDGSISRLDRFSQDGKTWRRIADITELDEFMRLHSPADHEHPTPTSSKPPPSLASADKSSSAAPDRTMERPSLQRASKKNTVYGLRSARALDTSESEGEPMRSLPVPDPNAIPRAPGIPREASGFANEIPDHAADTNAPPPAPVSQPAPRLSRASRSRTRTEGGLAGIPSGEPGAGGRTSAPPIAPIPSIPVKSANDDDDPTPVSSAPPPQSTPVPPPSARARSIPPRNSRKLSPHSKDTSTQGATGDPATQRGLGDEVSGAIAEAARKVSSSAPPSDAPTAVQRALPTPEAVEEDKAAEKDEVGPDARVPAWVWAIAVLLVVAVIAWLWTGTPTDDIANYQPADESRALATVRGYEEAIRYIGNLHGDAERPVIANQKLSRLHALWAQALRFEAFDLRTRVTDAEETADVAERKSKEATVHATEALRFATLARSQRQSEDADTLVALADAHRLQKAFKEAEHALTQARRIQGELSSDFLYVRALLKANKASDIAEARTDAQRAIETDASNLAARIVLLRALLARGDTSLAIQQLTELERRASDNPRIESLALAVRESTVQAAALSDAGTRDGQTNDASLTASAPTSEVPNLVPGYEALEDRQYASAERFFSKERARHPKHPAPLIALAELALRRERLWDAGAYLRRAEQSLASHPESRAALDKAQQALESARQTQQERPARAPDPKPDPNPQPKPDPKPKPEPKPEPRPSNPSTSPIHDNPYD